MNSGIYLLENTVNGKVYVGSSSNLRQRRRAHTSDLKKDTHWNEHLGRAVMCYGFNAFHFCVLEYCSSEDLLIREDWWMELLRSRDSQYGYNIRTAERHGIAEETKRKLSLIRKGKPLSQEHRERLSAAKKGKPGNRKGVTLTPEHRAKLSAAKKGKLPANLAQLHSPEVRSMVNAALLTPEVRSKLSVWQKGKKKRDTRRAI